MSVQEKLDDVAKQERRKNFKALILCCIPF